MISGRRKKPEPGPEIDLNQLPLQETVLILRRLALQALEDLLEGQSRTDLAARLTLREARLFKKGAPWRISLWRRIVHIPEGFPANLAIGMRELLSSGLLGIISKRQWHLRMRDRLAMATGIDQNPLLPRSFWPLIAVTAWTEPSFQHEVSWRIHRFLRTRPPISDGNLTAVILNPGTFWVLLAMAEIRPGLHWARAGELFRAIQADRLRTVARQQALMGQWAGFWDQWLIRRLCEHWQEALAQQPGGFRRALTSLPLMRNLSVPGSRFNFKRSFSGLWAWLLLPGKKVATPGNSSENLAPDLGLAIPNWGNQIPSWLESVYFPYKG